jgi:hypothetical protein
MGVDINAYVEGSVGQDPHEVAWERAFIRTSHFIE